jgi:hypothetical protein
MRRKYWPFLILFIIGCKNSSSPKDGGLSAYYHEFLIYVLSPSQETVKCEASFQRGGQRERAASLPEGYTVYLDGKPAPPDNEENPIYAIERNTSELLGDHVWTVKRNGVNVVEVPTSLSVCKLLSAQPSGSIGKEDLVMSFEGAKDKDVIECWFEEVNGRADNYNYYIKGNSITIPATDLKKLGKGPHSMEFSLLKTSPVMYNGKKVGIAETNYTLDPLHVVIDY